MDGSRIMDDLFTTYQRALMDMLFMGDTSNRVKYNCIMAEGVCAKPETRNPKPETLNPKPLNPKP
jgi:hypothetical protein